MPHAPRNDWPKHEEAVHWLDRLILDLKLQELGKAPAQPITLERLQDWERLRRDLERCREPLTHY